MDSNNLSRRRAWYGWSAKWFRWIHIYLSMVSFAAMLFFGVTGLTLNHPTWFGASEEVITDFTGEVSKGLLAGEMSDKLAIAELLRSRHKLRGQVSEFAVDEFECMVVFKGPGYAADIFIDRESGKYTATQTTTGIVAVFNDLHKGRDSGTAWSLLIDTSAIVMLLVSITGFALIFYLKKRLVSGLLTALTGTVFLVLVWLVGVA